MLSVLEVSLSFDNAVVNATVLKEMDEKWRRRFLTWGIAIAVFGMRIVFPLAIVAIAAGLGPIEAMRLSLTIPRSTSGSSSSAHVGIAGFGGAFLAMVGLKFFFDSDKDVHWIGVIESSWPSCRASRRWRSRAAARRSVGISSMLPDGGCQDLPDRRHRRPRHLHRRRGDRHDRSSARGRRRLTGPVVRSGLGAFLYLEVLDASFRFDGVIGAFALSNNMFIIALGLASARCSSAR